VMDIFGEQRIIIGGDGYAAQPGTGPSGETCKSCDHSYLKGGVSGRYWKCGLVKETGGKGTDIRSTAPACKMWASANKDGVK
jgi:hypothetical protein